MSSVTWIPLYIRDYLGKTEHLNATQSGAYFHLLMHYYQNDGLPTDEAALIRISRMTNRQWSQNRDILRSFFDDDWRHTRADSELAKMADISGKRRASALQMHSKSTANAEHKHTPSPSQSKKTSLNGAKTKEPLSVIWVTEDDPRFIPLASRWQQERKQKASPAGSRSASGIGFYFPADWVAEAERA